MRTNPWRPAIEAIKYFIGVAFAKKKLNAPSLNRGEIRFVTESGEWIESHPPRVNLHQPPIEDFTFAALDGREPEASG